MPIIQKDIEAKIRNMVESLTSGDPTKKDPDQTQNEFVEGLAKLIVDAIKSADITIPPGAVITTGSPTSQTNATPIKVVNGLS